ncbi:hypothetical protein [Modestobacter sp. I12A-02662]|uniref:hypothetical protein n=1 Tax=Modestobacter sp. I12A-02662 TaxID=1730496 RepID=UPI0034E04CE6
MPSHDEQRAWDEIRANCAEEAGEPAPPGHGPVVRPPRTPRPVHLTATVVVSGCIAALLVVLGAPVVGAAVAVAALPRWLLWHCWSSLDDVVVPPAPPAVRDAAHDGQEHASSGESRWTTPRTA